MTFQGRSCDAHGTPDRTGVLLVNLGTPDAPTPRALRRYLAEFLADPRVVEVPRPIWLAILYGVILPLRSPRSARAYAKVWTDQGSPLRVWSERLTEARRVARAAEAAFGLASHRAALREGEPCPRCGTGILAVHYSEYTLCYCPEEQTGGQPLKDRRLSRLLK